MSIHWSEDEQIQKIKSFWQEYGTFLLVGLIIVFGSLFGWKYWHKYHVQRNNQASIIFEQMLASDMNQKSDEFKLFATHLRDDYAKTPYSSMAALLAARKAAVSGDLAEASKNLNWIIKNSKEKQFRQIARIRNARLLLALHQPDEAFQIVQTIDDDNYLPMIHLVRGDIFTAMHKDVDAKYEYTEAEKIVPANSVIGKVIRMKKSTI